MGSCTRRHFLLSTCFLQMITIIERQVFDFLGYMWAPIMVNFFHIIFVIFGFYGAYHFRIKYIITYLIWNFIWIGWNAFLICFYLNVGTLDRDSDTLNLGTGSFSWFQVNGYGCKPVYPTNITSDDPYRPIRPERVDDCLVDYEIVEVIHSGVQCALALFGILGAILISYIFLDEDDRFDFMNGDAKSPQHTVVHPMYVSYSSIPTSASATLLSNKHHNHHNTESLQRQHFHHQQQQQKQMQNLNQNSPQPSNNNNTFLIHTNSKRSGSLSNSGSNKKINKIQKVNSNATIYSNQHQHQQQPQQQQQSKKHIKNIQRQQHFIDEHFYDDSTAKADQIYSNSVGNATNNWPQYAHQNYDATITPTSSHDNTTSSLSYASLQNSNATIAAAIAAGGGSNRIVGIASPLSNSNYSLTSNSINNNTNPAMKSMSGSLSNNSAGRFARIHAKPKPPKSSSYSSFISNNSGGVGGGSGSGLGMGMGGVVGGANVSANSASGSNLYRPDIKYTQISNDRLSSNYEEAEDDNFSLKNFKNDGGMTYVQFQKPTPAGLFLNQSNNNNLQQMADYQPAQYEISPNNNNVNNGLTTTGYEILLERGAILQPALLNEPAFNPLNRYINNGTSSPLAHSPHAYRRRYISTQHNQPTRPTNIPLPTIPHQAMEYDAEPSSPMDLMPSPPPPPMAAPRPHIFQPRSGHAPYPDLSPEVTEKYAMPTQYIPRSPIAARIVRRQRQQQHESSKLANTSANFCDQIRDTPPGTNVIDLRNQHIIRAKSHDRLSSASPLSIQTSQQPTELAPHVNRRSGRRDQKTRPRSYCNSITSGEDVIRGITLHDGIAVRHVNKISKHRQSLYSIEFGPSLDTLRSRTDTILDYDDRLNDRGGADEGGELSPKPMTPRRVKRRSVMARGANNRQSTNSRRSHHSGGGSSGTHPRSSTRSSRRKYQQNPVTKLLDQQQQQLQQHGNNHGYQQQTTKQQFGSFHHKTGAPLTETNLQTLNREVSTTTITTNVNNKYSNTNDIVAVGVVGVGGSLTKTNNNQYRSFRKNIPPDPIYYNMTVQPVDMLPQKPPTWQSQSPNVSEEPSSPTTLNHHHHHHHTSTSTVNGGHFNPTYQHSTTNLNDATDELYNNRPPSVRSSYSNFHGTRPLSLYNTQTTTENVFVGLTGAVPQIQHVAPSTPPLYQQHPLNQQTQQQQQVQHLPPPLPSPSYQVQGTRSSPQNIPFAKRTASRESIRSMAFLNSGPPAYNLNYHTPPDSETTM